MPGIVEEVPFKKETHMFSNRWFLSCTTLKESPEKNPIFGLCLSLSGESIFQEASLIIKPFILVWLFISLHRGKTF